MVQNGAATEMINGVVRIKWWKYRYVVLAALVVNVVLINHFFFDSSFAEFVKPSMGSEAVVLHPPSSEANAAIPMITTATATVTQVEQATGSPCAAVPTSKEVSLAKSPPITPTLLELKDYDFNGDYIGWPLKRVCDDTKWVQGFIFVCDNNSGGIGNIRNFILTCIRYGIEAGATGVIMPRIQTRSEKDLANIFTKKSQPFDYFFDEAHFRESMGAFCPQMKIYDDVEQIPNTENKKESKEFSPKDLNMDMDGCDGRGVNRHLDLFRTKIDEWHIKYQNEASVERPLTLRLRWATFFEWPIMRDGPEFAATFGDLLRIRKDIQELAAATIKELKKFTGEATNETDANPSVPPTYLGAHLRTESDALGFWPNFEQQSEGYMHAAETYKLKHAYLASGNATEGHRFGEIAFQKLGLKVTSKIDLLKGHRLEQLSALSWDQQALVDFLVLQKSTQFTGCSFSSFAMNIAIKRHLMTDGIFSRAWRSPGDKFSTLVGRFESWYGDWMFMYECMWP